MSQANLGRVYELFLYQSITQHLRFTNGVDPNTGGDVSFGGYFYVPVPVKITGLGSSANKLYEPELEFGNVSLLMADEFKKGSIVGAYVTYILTYGSLITTGQSLPPQRFVIRQIAEMGKKYMKLSLTHEVNRYNKRIPSKVFTNAEYPGIQLIRDL